MPWARQYQRPPRRRSREVSSTPHRAEYRVRAPWLPAAASHPKHAVPARALDHVVVDGRERDAEDGAGVARIDDTVVPDARGREERVALLLDLALHHLLDH